MSTDPLSQYVDKFLEASASGDLKLVTSIVKGTADINVKNDQGWSALMFASRNGQAEVAKILLDNGADTSVINATGQSALDIAEFWNHKSVANLLQKKSTNDITITGHTQVSNYFSKNPLNRLGNQRRSKEWVESVKSKSSTKYILFKELKSVVVQKPDNTMTKTMGDKYRLLKVQYDDIKTFLSEENPLVILLGAEIQEDSSADEKTSPVWFAVDISKLEKEKLHKIHAHAEVLPEFPGIMQLEESECGVVAQARSILAWHDRYPFCPTCGNSTNVADAGYKRSCSNKDCRSQKGIHNTSYPRLDPTVIMAVISPDRRKLLLGRGAKFPGKMWSCLAGFMEPGETIEAASRREVEEESGVIVGRVEYHSCQPWPMPASLMIGCLAYATSTEIKVDKEEIEEARWFERSDVIQMLNHKHPQGMFCPPEQAIAHQLIKTWVTLTSNL